MKEITLVMWNILWPLSCSIDSYLSTKTRLLSGQEQPSINTRAITALIQLIIWIYISKLIYN